VSSHDEENVREMRHAFSARPCARVQQSGTHGVTLFCDYARRDEMAAKLRRLADLVADPRRHGGRGMSAPGSISINLHDADDFGRSRNLTGFRQMLQIARKRLNGSAKATS
jgi:hypothetical protein